MRVQLRILALFFIITSFFVLSVREISASEGKAELRSTTSDDYRCSVYSVLMQNRDFKVLVSCRDLIYPSDADVFGYVIWANPIVEGEIIKMGQLNFGKRIFDVGRRFERVFVTKEPNPSVKVPNGPVVMEGNIQIDAFLDRPIPNTPTPTEEAQDMETGDGESEGDNGEKNGEAPSTRNRLSTAFRRASVIIAILLLIGAVAALIVVLRSRRR